MSNRRKNSQVLPRRLILLLSIRWIGQLGDGVFQSSLAAFVLFSPERQTSAMAAALAFCIVLLPYSLVAPIAGIFLDRFRRRNLIALANVIRVIDLIAIALIFLHQISGVVLVLFVLVAFGLNRLILAGSSAGLPRMVFLKEPTERLFDKSLDSSEQERLVTANALLVTGGTICVVMGGGFGIGIKSLLDGSFKESSVSFLLVLVSALLYLIAACVSRLLKPDELGPEELIKKPWQLRGAKLGGFGEIHKGGIELLKHKDSLRGITTTAIQRGGFTALTLMTLLLERNVFHNPNNPDAGLAGFALAISIAGIGIGLGSITTPFVVVRIGRHRWIRYSLYGSLIPLVMYSIFLNHTTLVISGFFIGFFGQAIKVSSDALVQSEILDMFRGRVFAFYDVAVNSAIVMGSLLAAAVLPDNGKSVVLPLLILGIYLAVAVFLLTPRKFKTG